MVLEGTHMGGSLTALDVKEKKLMRNYDDRPKGHALMLALAAGLTPKTLVALGYPRATVYRWNKNYRLAIKALKQDLHARVLSLSQIKKKEQIP